MQEPALVAQGRLAVAREEQGTIKVDPVGPLRQKHSRGHGERRRHHATDHDLEARSAGRLGKSERLGQSAGLVELDVDGIVAPAEAIQVAARMQRFIGTHRDFAADLSPARHPGLRGAAAR